MITAASIAKALNGHKAGGDFIARCPAHNDRSPSLSLRDADDKVLVKCHAGCDQARVIAALQRLGLWPEGNSQRTYGPRRTEVEIPTSAKPAPVDGERDRAVARAIELWRDARSIVASPVAIYLVSRGLERATGLHQGHVLRFHPVCPFRLEDGTIVHLPAMLALFRDIITDEPCGIHRTALKPDGNGKSDVPGLGNPKKMLGRAKGAAIKLTPDAEVAQGLAIAEGIETALTALCAGLAPVWALGSAGAIADFPVLPGIEALTILADHDEAGLKAARACAKIWADAGKEVTITYPSTVKSDWNDIAKGANAAA